MAKMSKAAQTFDPFAETTPPRSTASDPDADHAGSEPPSATFQPPVPALEVMSGVVVNRPELPEPHDPLSDGDLTDREREELAVCEDAIGAAQKSFITRGRALHVIRDGRHYRKTHETFDDYLEIWGMTRQDASRDILTYRLGERLSQICDKINRDQMLKLVPIADRHGEAAAELVYQTVLSARDGKVTAAVLKSAAEVVPEQWDPETAVARVRALLAGEVKPAIQGPANLGERVEKFRATIRRNVKKFHDLPPGPRRELADEFRALADELAAE